MTVAPRLATVLVASERGADVAHVRDALANEFTRVEVSTHGELAVADFERVRPDVVVLALDSIDKSQQYCVGLMRFSKVAQAHPHRYGILCAPVDLGGLDSAVWARATRRPDRCLCADPAPLRGDLPRPRRRSRPARRRRSVLPVTRCAAPAA